ncbi:LysM peptidoglycan-binding domain-containing protein, partial [Chromobacterium vaccinii]|uniref:LysM peptidoglycan-binding domain-containing protein n=1 Tax=Chromobacterium vaccinii TaxID=1108595 RepID=UPI0031D38A6A
TLQVEAEGQPEQRRTSYGYDANNRLVSQRGDVVHTYTLTGADLKPLEADVAPTETRRYDAAGNLVEFIDAGGNVTRAAYDSQNRKVRERNGDGYVTTWAYDGAGNVIEQRVYATAVGLPADGGAPQPADGACRVTRFEYDNNNRLKRTITPSQNIDVIYRGENGNPGFQSAVDLAVSRGYDANGNTVRETDARGNSVYRWFDRAGRKLLEVDAAGYATAWAYNSVGKPVRETRYAVVLSGINGQTTLDQARQQLKSGNDDRVSEFDYDRMGRVSEERRLNVKVSVDDGQSDGLNTVRTQYLYNALGQVRQQIDAKGGIADIDYDSLGRETKRHEAAYGADQGGLRPEARTYYNALGQSVKVERNNLNRLFLSSEYGAGGRLLSQTDAEGNVIRYQYDAAGNLTRTLRDRQSPDGTTVTDETRFAYSAAKLQIASLDAGSGLWLETAYNAWGQITGKRTSPDRRGAWQEFSEYDGLGRLVKGNAGGVTKLYGYDANGNAMLTVESGDDGGDALRGMTMAGLRAIIEQRANSNAPLDTLRLTMSDYDARNQRTATYQPVMVKVRDLGLARVMPWFGAQTVQGSDSVVKVGPVGKSNGTLPSYFSTNSVWCENPVTVNSTMTITYVGQGEVMPDDVGNFTTEIYGTVRITGRVVGDLSAYGSATPQLNLAISMHRLVGKALPVINASTVVQADGSFTYSEVLAIGSIRGNVGRGSRPKETYFDVGYSAQLAKPTSTGSVQNFPYSAASGFMSLNSSGSVSLNFQTGFKQLHFKDQPSDVNRLLLLVRGKGTNEGWRVINVPRFSGNWFTLDWSGMAHGEYEFRCLGYNGDGQLKSARQGTMRLDDSGAPPQLSNDPMPKAFMYGPGQGLMNVAGLGDGVTQGRIRFRVPGGDWNDERDVNMATSGGPLKGWLQFDPAAMGLAAGQRYEYKLRGLGGETVIGSFIPNDPNSVSEPQRWLDQPQTVRLFNQPAGVTSGKVLYRRAGSNDARQEAPLVYDPVEGSYVWNCADLAGRLSQPTDFEVECQLYGSAGQLLNLVGGTVRLGQQNEIQASLAGKSLSAKVTFAPSQLDGVKMELRYHLKGSQSDTDWQNVILTRGAQGFEFNVDGLAVGDYEYRYQLRNAAGQLLNGADGQPLSVSGYMRRGAPGERDRTGDMEWAFIGINNPNATITRSQHYNAFGEVDSETDGIGNTSRYVYSAAGKLLSKQDPQVSITLENGQKQTVSPLTQYRYDAMGNTVATIDANGKTNRQRWLAGSQNGQGKVTDEWHADGGVKTMKYDAQGNLASSQDEIKRLTRYGYDNLGQLKRVDRAGGGYDEYDYDSAGQRIRHRATSTGSDVFTDTTRYDSLGRVRETVSATGRHLNYDYRWDAQLKGAGGTVVGGWRCVTRNDNLGNNWQEDAVNLFGQKVEHTDLGGRVIAYDYNNAGQLRWQHGIQNSAQSIVYRYYGNGYLMSLEDSAIDSYTLYEYDKEGRKTFEGYRSIRAKDTYQYAEIQYDALGRVTQIQDPKFLTRYEYDAVGNRRRIYAEYHDPVDGSQQTQDNWYTYDEMNRLAISMGRLDNGIITRGGGGASTGVQIAYDLAGQRRSVINANNGVTENYAYTDNGYLKDTWLNGKLAAHRENDLLGRATEYRDYRWDGDGGQKSKTATEYDRDNKVLSQVQDDKSRTTFKMYNDGTLEHTEQKDGDTTTTTYYTYEWWDEAKQSTITAKPYNPNAPGWKDGTSHLRYDANGHLAEAIDEVANRSLRYVSNAQGLVLRREELNKGSTYKKQDYYYLDGKQVGAVGNDGLVRVNYAQALAQLNLGNRKDEYRHGYQVSSADFDQNYEPIGPNYPAQAPGTVTARDGDTLQVIAANLWGDKSLWYLLADANGLTGAETLKAGQVLRVPNKVTNLHNNSGTY